MRILWDNPTLVEGYQADDRWVVENQENLEREEKVVDIYGIEQDHLTIKYPLYDANRQCVGSGGCSF